jgi:hypothetical protein
MAALERTEQQQGQAQNMEPARPGLGGADRHGPERWDASRGAGPGRGDLPLHIGLTGDARGARAMLLLPRVAISLPWVEPDEPPMLRLATGAAGPYVLTS